MDLSDRRLDEVEQRINELKDRAEEITSIAAQRDKERTCGREAKRSLDRPRASKLYLQITAEGKSCRE